MTFGRFNGQLLHFAEENPGQGRAIVFANSLGTDFRIWDGVAARLGAAWRLLRYDLRGHGLSEAPPAPYTIADHVSDLEALLEARGIKAALVVGLSVGGLIAQGLAARRADLVRALVLCDTAHRIGTVESWDARILERWFSAHYRATMAEDLAGYRNMLTRTPVEGYIGTCTALRDGDLTATTRSLTQPTLCVVGEEDGATPPNLVRTMSALIPGARFEIIAGAGHLPCIESPALMAARIGAFAKENLGA
jgi:3-oxoadipate enol-lactonase